jgi:hypothetical protein
MKSLISLTFTVKCELCRQQDALADCRLCEVCGDAIVRLLWISQRARTETLERAKRARQINHEEVVAHAFSRFIS